MGSLPRILAALAPALLGATALGAQVNPAWAEDPYTKGEADALKKAGYVSLGPFTWGDDHDSRWIDKDLAHAKIKWIETEHFKLGCSLPSFKVPMVGKWKTKLRKELKELKKKLPEVNSNTRVLDPWLRAHLFAYRLEEMYADVSRVLGVSDKDFPKEGETSSTGRYMGKGPYLGMPAKYTVLLLTKSSDLMRYAQRAGSPVDPSKPAPVRLNFVKQKCLFFGTATELARGSLVDDKSLHCHAWFYVVQTLLSGYKYYAHSYPAWCSEGVAHWYVLAIDPEEHVFTGIKGDPLDKRKDPEWNIKVRKRVKNNDYEPMEKLMNMMSPHEMTFGDHMAAWSRIDFLIKKHPKEFAKFMDRMKAPVVAEAGKTPTNEAILKRQSDCFAECIGMDPKAFDAAWVRYVNKTYPRK